MNMFYRFTSDDEPTEEQLAQLMHEVAVEAKQRAMEADKKFRDELTEAIISAAALQKQLEEKRTEENKP